MRKPTDINQTQLKTNPQKPNNSKKEIKSDLPILPSKTSSTKFTENSHRAKNLNQVQASLKDNVLNQKLNNGIKQNKLIEHNSRSLSKGVSEQKTNDRSQRNNSNEFNANLPLINNNLPSGNILSNGGRNILLETFPFGIKKKSPSDQTCVASLYKKIYGIELTEATKTTHNQLGTEEHTIIGNGKRTQNSNLKIYSHFQINKYNISEESFSKQNIYSKINNKVSNFSEKQFPNNNQSKKEEIEPKRTQKISSKDEVKKLSSSRVKKDENAIKNFEKIVLSGNESKGSKVEGINNPNEIDKPLTTRDFTKYMNTHGKNKYYDLMIKLKTDAKRSKIHDFTKNEKKEDPEFNKLKKH